MTEKLDLKKLDGFQAKPDEFRLLEIAEAQYLMIDGRGDPNTSEEYAAALEALYPVAYKLKFASKQQLGRDYVVPPLEGLWWADDMSAFTSRRDKSTWRWTMMLMVPEWIGESLFRSAIENVKAKNSPAKIDEVRLERLDEGLCVQTLHVGPFDDEGPVIERMHRDFIAAQNLALRGTHHEIYLGDPRRVAPEKLRTILRQPVSRVVS